MILNGNRQSLRLRLIVVLSFAAALIWLLSTALAWHQARKEVNEMFDAQQILLAKRLASSNLRHILIERKKRGGFLESQKHAASYDDDALSFAIFTQQGDLLLADDAKGEALVFAPVTGFSTATLKSENALWRIFWLPSDDGRLLIAVGQNVAYRNEVVNKMVFSQLWVWLASLPLLIGLIILLINKELKSLREIQQVMKKRSPEERSPLPVTNIPAEIQPLVLSLNQFFDRTSTVLQRERRFTSDAAHELRSPLAGLRIQAELAQLAGDDHAMRETALSQLTQGIDRAAQVIEQLLTLSRLDDLTKLEDVSPIAWEMLILSLFDELKKQRDLQQIGMSLEIKQPPKTMLGQPILLRLMLRNLLENAIKYGKMGTEIRLFLMENQLVIEDNGGGVDDHDLLKLGQRFYRPAGQNEKGSGLGLSIVFRIAELHGYKVRLENYLNMKNEKGLRVIIQFFA